ncbi:fungal-specific transcription factor domain-containing protein [Geopyxis carbonaria]|nr:fungal-specific transcription factor domain-containing protein [Geopyxis carbonaria]
MSVRQFSPGTNLTARLSISSASTSSSGASSMASRAMSTSSSPESSAGSPRIITMQLPQMIDGTVAKIEELDDDEGNRLMDAPPLPSPEENGVPIVETLGTEAPGKRGRGRPRKHPLPTPKTVQKVTKGRSKTGCITCRRRKKKCDEAKPDCNNCVKNSVLCEGYPQREIWQPGRQKNNGNDNLLDIQRLVLTQAARNSISVISRELPTLIDGVETRMDQHLLDHFTHRVSRILTLFDEESNPFRDYLLPLAMRNRALMHSLLALSSSHLANTVEQKPDYEYWQKHHFGECLKFLQEGIQENGTDHAATALILCLDSICKGDTSGSYRPHLDAARFMLGNRTTEEEEPLQRFLLEFFTYHDVVNSVTVLSRTPMILPENLILPAFILQTEAGALLGVLDGLFVHLSKITILRKQIRERKAQGIKEMHPFLSQAVALDREIREWTPPHVPGSPRYIAAQLYRQCTWVYLYRTIQPSCDSPKIRKAVELGLEYLRNLPEQSGTQSILLMPLFLLACAAFDPAHRPEISRRFEGLHKWSGLNNIVPAHDVVKKIWQAMDAGDEEKSWDWEMMIERMGYDFLVT